MKKIKKKLFFFCFTIIFINILSVFVSFLQTYYDIYFFHVLFLNCFHFQIIFCIYLLHYLLILFCYFPNIFLLCLVSQLYFFHNMLLIFKYNKRNYNNPLFSFRLQLFIMIIAFLCSYTKNEFYNHFL